LKIHQGSFQERIIMEDLYYFRRLETENQDKLRNRLFQLVGHPFNVPGIVEDAIRIAAIHRVEVEKSGDHDYHNFEMVLRVFTKWAGNQLFPKE
jgi:hypothetical protein